MKNIFILIKRITVSFFLLYTFNLITIKIGFFIPINVYTISLITLIDFPGIILLIILRIIF